MPTSAQLHWICSVPLGITISIFGIIGNVLSVFIWRRVIKKNRQGNPSTAVYLITLGLCDIGLLVFFILTESISSAAPVIKTNYAYAAFFAWFSFPMLYIFVVASIWLVVGVTINRWVLVTFPTRAKDFYSKKRTYLGIALILLFSILINVPHWFNFHVIPRDQNGTYLIQKTAYGLSQGAVNYEFWCHCIVLVLVPWTTVAVLNTLIVRKLRERTAKMISIKSRSNNENQERNLTTMLLVITCSFLILIAFQCVTQCFYMLEYKKVDDIVVWYRVDKSFAFGKLGVVINSTINCIFYCFFGTSFRKELRESFATTLSLTIMTSPSSNSSSIIGGGYENEKHRRLSKTFSSVMTTAATGMDNHGADIRKNEESQSTKV